MTKPKKSRSGYKLVLIEEDCPDCEGKGFTEYQAGTICVGGEHCKETRTVMRRRKVKEQK